MWDAPREKQELITKLFKQKQTCSDIPLSQSQHGVTKWKGTLKHVSKDSVHCWKSVSSFKQAETPCIDHQFPLAYLHGTSKVAPLHAQVVWTCLYYARFGRPDCLWTVSMMARSVTKWKKAGDETLALDKLCQSNETSQTKLFFLETIIMKWNLG